MSRGDGTAGEKWRLGSLTVSAPVLPDLLEVHDRMLPGWIEKKRPLICDKTYILSDYCCKPLLSYYSAVYEISVSKSWSLTTSDGWMNKNKTWVGKSPK